MQRPGVLKTPRPSAQHRWHSFALAFGVVKESLELIHAGNNKTKEVATTTLDFPSNKTTTFLVGTEEDNVYQAHRYDGSALPSSRWTGRLLRLVLGMLGGFYGGIVEGKSLANVPLLLYQRTLDRREVRGCSGIARFCHYADLLVRRGGQLRV